MILGSSPPTTSGIVVITGTNFSAADAEFPVVTGKITPIILDLAPTLIYSESFVPDHTADIKIEQTKVTTSGIVVVEIFPGAGAAPAPFVPPVVINERIFPIFKGTNFERTFPEENQRIFPVLPQFSTITPGD